MLCDEGSSVVEFHAAPQMKRVDAAIGRDVPSLGERGVDVRGGVEGGEAVEEVANGAARRYVGRE